MFKKISKLVYFLCPYFVSIFPIISLFQNNINEVKAEQIAVPILITILTNLLLIIILKKYFIREIITIILIGFWICIFYYKNFYTAIEFLIEPNIIRKRYVIFLWLSGISLIIFFLSNLKIVYTRIIFVFSYFMFFLILIQFLKSFNDIKIVSKVNNTHFDTNYSKYRDIYCIILDGYPNSEILINNFSFNNSFFTNSLVKNKFHFFENSRSNYTLTFLSMASLLNMEYINYLSNKKSISSTDRSFAYNLVSNNKVFTFLKKNNYKIINISSGWGPTEELENANLNLTNNKYLSNFTSVLIKTTIIEELVNILNININSDFINVTFAFEELAKVRKIKGPKFVLAHILSPHDSYLFKPDRTAAQNFDKDGLFNKTKYINSLKVLNDKVLSMVDSLLSDSINNPIIIIQSDHGSSSSFIPKLTKWKSPSRENIHERVSNFAAYYLPEKIDYLKDTISPVNTFRIIFNKYFKTKFKILPNKIYFSNYDEPYRFTEFRE